MSDQTPNQPQARNIHDIYTFYLSADHLEEGKLYPLTIAEAVIKPIFNVHANKDLDELVLHFKEARRSLKCNKTQVETLWDLTGTDDHTQWKNVKIILEKVPARGGKKTIKISKPEEG